MKEGISSWGLTSDEKGHIFVCDEANACVHMFHVQHRQHMGVLLSEGQQGIGVPLKAEWCKEKSSLVLAHRNQKAHRKLFISVIKIT